jgi:hypothetical protein
MRNAFIIRSMVVSMMEAVRTSETSIYFNQTTWRYIPESCRLYARRRENLKSHNETSWPNKPNKTLLTLFCTWHLNWHKFHCKKEAPDYPCLSLSSISSRNGRIWHHTIYTNLYNIFTIIYTTRISLEFLLLLKYLRYGTKFKHKWGQYTLFRIVSKKIFYSFRKYWNVRTVHHFTNLRGIFMYQ